MCSRNVKRPARRARPARAAGCRLKGARNVAPAPPPAPRRGGREPRQQRVTRGSGTRTSGRANAASRRCADRTGRTRRLRHNGTEQVIRPRTGTLARRLAAVARHPLGVRAVTDRGGTRPLVRSIARWQRTGPGGRGRRPDRLRPGLTGAPVGAQRGLVPGWHRGQQRSRCKGGKQAELPHKRGRPRPGGRAGVAARSRSGCGRQNRLPEKHSCM